MENHELRKTKTHQHKSHKEEYINISDSEQTETEEGSSKDLAIHKPLLKEIANTLSSIVSQNKTYNKHKKDHSLFSHKNIPKISLYDYLFRIQKYAEIENSTIIIALIYIDRICNKKGIILTKYNIHRILFTSILISIKYNEDIIYDNLFYSKIAGVPVNELNLLEKEFLNTIDFALFVPDTIYQKYYEFLNFYEKA